MGENTIKFGKEIAKDGFEILKVSIDGRKIYIGSKYNNVKYIENLNNELNEIDLDTLVVVFGIGTGKILEYIDVKKYKYNNILFVEPLEEIYLENAKNIGGEFSNYISQKDLIENIGKIIGEKEVLKFKFVEFANYASVFETEYIELYKSINEIILNTKINMTTGKIFNDILLENYFTNLKRLNNYFGINNLKDILEGKPAIVVSAGPSLEKNIDVLKENKEKFCVITGQRTVKTLIAKGITPDFVCSVDPQNICFDMIKEVDCSNLKLVHYITSNHKLVNRFDHNFIVNDGILNEFLSKKLDVWIDELYVGGSVAHTCMSLADYMGCSPIVFVGQDLAYTGEKYHAGIATNWDNQIDNNGTYILVEDINGNMVKTDEMLDYYRKNIEKYIKTSDKKFINATEGGANIKGTEIFTLKEVTNKFNVLDKGIINDVLNQENYIRLNSINLKLEFENLINMQKKSNEYFDKLDKINSDEKVNKVFNQVNNFISEIKENPYIIFFINDIENKILKDKEYSISYDESTKELIKKMKLQLKEFMKELSKLLIKIDKIIKL